MMNLKNQNQKKIKNKKNPEEIQDFLLMLKLFI